VQKLISILVGEPLKSTTTLRRSPRPGFFWLTCLLLLLVGTLAAADEPAMFSVPGLPADPESIDWGAVHGLKFERTTVFRAQPGSAGYNMHPYITHFDGKFWAMWSSGGEFEDVAGQQVRFATSADGMRWSEAGLIAPCDPASGLLYIARSYWIRDGELLALATRAVADNRVENGARKRLGIEKRVELHWFKLNESRDGWVFGGVVLDDTLSNYEPSRLPSGEWLMSRRDRYGVVSVTVGGRSAISDWTIHAVPEPSDGHEMSEPASWELPDGRLTMVFRDQSSSFRLYRSFSRDGARTWTTPARTNFPDGRAKTYVLRLRDGRYVLANNPKPGASRVPLGLSLSNDGLVFTRTYALLGEATKARHPNFSKRNGHQYPHLVEVGAHLYIIYSSNQEDIEVLRIPVSSL
jgi:hypothetical protein